MSGEKGDDLLIAVALTRFSVQFKDVDPELAADCLLKHDVDLTELWKYSKPVILAGVSKI